MSDFTRNLGVLPQNNFPQIVRNRYFLRCFISGIMGNINDEMFICLLFFVFFTLCLYFMLIAQYLWCNLVVGAQMRDTLCYILTLFCPVLTACP